MENTLIRWKLREVMDRHGIQAKDLADELGVSRNAVSNLRGVDMPRIDGARLNDLLLALNKMRRADSKLITPVDLIEFTLGMDELKGVNVNV